MFDSDRRTRSNLTLPSTRVEYSRINILQNLSKNGSFSPFRVLPFLQQVQRLDFTGLLKKPA